MSSVKVKEKPAKKVTFGPLEMPIVDLGLEFSHETITPEEAKRILNEHSLDFLRASTTRRVSKPYEKYASFMKNDGWMLNGSAIVFDRDGILLDGYQRLEAVILADKPVRMLVARGARRETLHTMDQHRRRSYTTLLQSEGIENASDVYHALTKLARIENGMFMLSDYTPNWERLDIIRKSNPEIIEASLISPTLPKENVIPPQTLTPFIAMAIMSGYKAEVLRFISEMIDIEASSGSPARMLHINLKSVTGIARQKNGDPDIALGLCIMAFNDYVQGKKVLDSYIWLPDYGEDIELNSNGKPVSMRLSRKVAPENCGLPVMLNYPGLKNGKIHSGKEERNLFDGSFAEKIRSVVKKVKGDPEVFCVHITPEAADQILKTMNTGNRKILKSHENKIARDIKNNLWMINAQPICFSGNPFDPNDKKTRLINGQHRLKACVSSQIPIDVPIAIGVPEAAFATFDNHARKPKSAITGDDRVLRAAAVFQWREDNNLVVDGKERPTATELQMTIESHPELSEYVSQVRKKSARSSFDEMATGGVIAYFLYRIHRDRPDLAPEFAEKFRSGTMLTPKEPIFALRRKLKELRKGASKGSRREVLNIMLNEWNKHKKWIEKNAAKTEETQTELPL